jgi:hypothetical protein
MIMKYDVKSMNKSTKVLPPMVNTPLRSRLETPANNNNLLDISTNNIASGTNAYDY